MAIGQDIGMGTAYGGGITGLNTGVNLAATGLQAPTYLDTIQEMSTAPYGSGNLSDSPRFAPSRRTQDLNQLYKTAMDAFTRTGRGTWGEGYNDMPEQYKNWAMTTGVPSTLATGIATLPTGAQTNIVPTAEPTYPTQDEFLQQKQAAWRTQNPDPAVMPNFRITGTDLPASEAAGYDVPIFEAYGPSELTLKDPGAGGSDPLTIPGTIPEQYMDFFNSQFYDPGAGGLGVMTPVILPTGETITFPDSESARQFQQYLDSRVFQAQAANGGIVGLDYLTRRL